MLRSFYRIYSDYSSYNKHCMNSIKELGRSKFGAP